MNTRYRYDYNAIIKELYPRKNQWGIDYKDYDKYNIVILRVRKFWRGKDNFSTIKVNILMKQIWKNLFASVVHMRNKHYNLHQKWIVSHQAKIRMKNKSDEHISR